MVLHEITLRLRLAGALVDTVNKIRSFEAVIRMQESTHKVPKSASQAVRGRMQLKLHAKRRAPRALGLGARNVRLDGHAR